MIHLLHGENLVDSRRALVKLLLNYSDTQTFSRKQESLLTEKIKQKSGHLFGGKSAFFLENFSGDWKILPQNLPDYLDLILWAPRKISPVPPVVKAQSFDSFKSLSAFKFSDALFSKNSKQALEILHVLLQEKEPPEKIIGTLNRGLSLLYAFKQSGSVPVSPFVAEKVKQQARFWTLNELKKGFYGLIKADLDIKEGTKPATALSSFIGKVSI